MNNKPKTKLLTISLLCCGRAETTERCLKSLMPIREAIDSEIQVVDTGCSAETRAVIEKYADEVFEFTWCNDFAKARNFQLDQANGKMFLFIDDDEFFLDCKYIIEFFNDPKCTTYNIGGYFQRNYLDFEGKEFEDIEVVRMCSVTPNTYFVGKVHEYIEPAYGNAMFMDAKAGHYGYVYKTQEDNIKHSMRNIPLLKEMIEEQPDNLRWPYQLAQEYRAVKMFDELYDICHDGFYHSFDIHEEESIRYRGPFAVGMAIALEELERDDELLKFYEDQMSKGEILQIPKAKLTLYAAKVMFVRGENDKCVEMANYYFDIMERFGSDRGQMFMQGGIFINDAFDEMHTNMMYCYLMTCGLRKNDFGPLVHYYRRITWDSPVVRINKGFVVTLVMKAAEFGYKLELKNVLNKFFIRPGFRDILQAEIESNYKVMSFEQLDNIKKAFKGTDKEKEMSLFVDVRLDEISFASQEEFDSYTQLKEYLTSYIDTVYAWYDLHKSWSEPDANEATPKEVILANGLSQILESADKDTTQTLKLIKNAIGVRDIMDGTLGKLSKLYAAYRKVQLAREEDQAKFEEMYKLEEALLKQIAELDAAGQNEEALATYNQLVTVLQNTYGVDTLHV